MKNIVFIPNVNVGDDRSNPYEYSIKSWKYWCNKNDCELLVLDELLFPVDYMKITWQRYYLFDVLESNNIEYDQVLLVDADTIIHPDCPNFFKETDYKYCGVVNDGCYEWVARSIKDFSNLMFNSKIVHPWEYINGGFHIVNKIHKPFFDSIKEYYKNNQEKILNSIEKSKTATDQTIINFLLKEENIEVKLLPTCYNLQDLFRKSLLHLPGSSYWEDSLENLFSAGWIYHFNAIPQNPRHVEYWMERTYNELYGELND
tara:strand:- start:218 stop:994 length:777 start_codon:yes stop_codon:yes gene_type:complete